MDYETYEPLYYAALRADEHFHAAVVKQFGEKRAGDMRYVTRLHNDETLSAGRAHIKAQVAFLQAVRTMRGTT